MEFHQLFPNFKTMRSNISSRFADNAAIVHMSFLLSKGRHVDGLPSVQASQTAVADASKTWACLWYGSEAYELLGNVSTNWDEHTSNKQGTLLRLWASQLSTVEFDYGAA